MIELTKGTGVAAGKTVPLRVPLGTDGWTRIKAKCEDTLKICDDWEEAAKSTDVQQVQELTFKRGYTTSLITPL